MYISKSLYIIVIYLERGRAGLERGGAGLERGSWTEKGGAGLTEGSWTGDACARSITIPSVAVGRGLESAQIWRLARDGFLGNNIQATEPEDNFRAQVMGGWGRCVTSGAHRGCGR